MCCFLCSLLISWAPAVTLWRLSLVNTGPAGALISLPHWLLKMSDRHRKWPQPHLPIRPEHFHLHVAKRGCEANNEHVKCIKTRTEMCFLLRWAQKTKHQTNSLSAISCTTQLKSNQFPSPSPPPSTQPPSAVLNPDAWKIAANPSVNLICHVCARADLSEASRASDPLPYEALPSRWEAEERVIPVNKDGPPSK